MPRHANGTVWLVALAAALALVTALGPTLHLHFGGWALIAVFAVCSAGALAGAFAPELRHHLAALRAQLVFAGHGYSLLRMLIVQTLPPPTRCAMPMRAFAT